MIIFEKDVERPHVVKVIDDKGKTVASRFHVPKTTGDHPQAFDCGLAKCCELDNKGGGPATIFRYLNGSPDMYTDQASFQLLTAQKGTDTATAGVSRAALGTCAYGMGGEFFFRDDDRYDVEMVFACSFDCK